MELQYVITDLKELPCTLYMYIHVHAYLHVHVHLYTSMQVFSVDNATCTRNLVGYILMDLRTAQIGSKVRLFQLFQVFPVYVK